MKKTITFKTACRIIKNATAYIVNGHALAYPVLDEHGHADHNDCIKISWQDEDGVNENTFTSLANYAIDDKGLLVIDEIGNRCILQILKSVRAR